MKEALEFIGATDICIRTDSIVTFIYKNKEYRIEKVINTWISNRETTQCLTIISITEAVAQLPKLILCNVL